MYEAILKLDDTEYTALGETPAEAFNNLPSPSVVKSFSFLTLKKDNLIQQRKMNVYQARKFFYSKDWREIFAKNMSLTMKDVTRAILKDV